MTNTADTAPYGSYGYFEPQDMTDEEWAAYDQMLMEEMADFESRQDMSDFYVDLDPEPPF